MKNHKKIGVVGILGQDEIIKEERAIKITAPHRFEELDIKTLLRNERRVIPPDFYNKRKKK